MTINISVARFIELWLLGSIIGSAIGFTIVWGVMVWLASRDR